MFKHVPNILTIIRFLLIPFIIYFLAINQYIVGVILFIISGITDVVDGAIARKFNFITDFGKLMDPLADKLTQISVLATLMIKELIPVWILAIVIAKEAVMIAGASFLYGRDVVVSSKWFGKLATVLFFIAIVCSCFISYWNMSIDVNNPLPDFAQYIYYLALVSSIFSLVMYFLTFSKKGYIKKEDFKLQNK
ncbi:cDP-alcohol phosphatidyltransferase [Clostridium sp. CAG:273]|jgi:CDP-diacylglycerol--glycerol-3-phosphate 3-phosphatidyltransferase|nr:CDP-diacylglycerol--glycerol-3-phosphate 3-phosphatidyltransferase [Clostridia bacterium]CDE84456.1 cDP-alcohol phosphatidyltransferase [Clostridium sp. CAG:273]